jgi:GntR family transcriptional regulator
MAFRPLDPADTRPVYIQLADRIRDAIRDGHLPQARPLPVARALVAHYGVSRFTLTRAVGLLTDEGIVRTVNGVRTFVCGMPSPEPDGPH